MGAEQVTDAELYERHAPELVRFATVLAGPSGADDLVAETVARVFAHPGWPNVRERRAYLFRAVLNAARERERAESRRQHREALAAAPEAVDEPLARPEGGRTTRGKRWCSVVTQQQRAAEPAQPLLNRPVGIV